MSDVLTTPMRPHLLHHTHNEPRAGTDEVLNCLQEEAYWVGMTSNVEKHGREYLNCQQEKQSLHAKASVTSIPIGHSWEMVVLTYYKYPCHTSTSNIFW